MSGGTFATEAPKYWVKGLPVTPTQPGTKQPAYDLKGWQGLAAAVPGEQKQRELLERYADFNIGLLLGVQNLLGIDIDDPVLVPAFLKFLGLNRSDRRVLLSGKKGKKGLTIFARMLEGHKAKSMVLKSAAGNGNVDVLGTGKMTILPPSLHPETGEPYAYVGTPLSDADIDLLPVITPEHLSVLGLAIGSEYILPIMEGTATHEPGLALTASLVAKGATDDLITAIFEAFLPDAYEGNTLEELPGWIASAREKGFDQKKGGGNTIVSKLLDLAVCSGVELFNDGDRKAYVTLPPDDGRLTLRIRSDDFTNWLRHLAYRAFEKPLASTAPLDAAIESLEAIALYDGEIHPVDTRIAGSRDLVEIDLGRPDGQRVVINASGWRVEDTGTSKLVRGSGFGALPNPAAGAGLQGFRELLGLDEHTFHLVLAFLLNALNPRGPYLILLVEGEQGSGKSLFTQMLKRIVDPNLVSRLRLPDDQRNLLIFAKEYRLINFDNASGMKAEISDALCMLATGGAVATRKLYKDDDLHVMSSVRCFMINGISSFATRPDLMERGIPVRLQPMPEGSRRQEAEILAEFERLLPSILAELYDAVSTAIRRLSEIIAPTTIRMADAAAWILAGSPAFGVEDDAIIRAIETAQDDFFVERVNDDPLVMKLRAITQFKPFEGYVGDLFAELEVTPNSGLPRSPSQLTKTLTRLRPAMARAGVKVEFGPKDKRGRLIRLSSDPKGPPPDLKF